MAQGPRRTGSRSGIEKNDSGLGGQAGAVTHGDFECSTRIGCDARVSIASGTASRSTPDAEVLGIGALTQPGRRRRVPSGWRPELVRFRSPSQDARRRLARSLAHLPVAMARFDEGRLYDNSGSDRPHREVATLTTDTRWTAEQLPGRAAAI